MAALFCAGGSAGEPWDWLDRSSGNTVAPFRGRRRDCDRSGNAMRDSPDRCELCGGAAETQNPLVPDEFYPGVQLHLHCLNSAAGARWTRARAEADPLYARYLSLSAMGHHVECSACGSSERISPKAIGMGAGHWEVNCRSCHRHRPHLSAYRGPGERELYDTLCGLALEFRLSADPAGILARVEELAAGADSLFAGETCSCGGRFSVAARPRCSRCREVLFDSPFHFTLVASAPVSGA